MKVFITEISKKIQNIYFIHIHGLQRMKPTDFGNPQTFYKTSLTDLN